MLLSTLMLVALVSSPAYAGRDSMSGAIVQAAQSAIAEGRVDPVLTSVGADEEAALRDVFKSVMRVQGNF